VEEKAGGGGMEERATGRGVFGQVIDRNFLSI
jgi:hypothetical protein